MNRIKSINSYAFEASLELYSDLTIGRLIDACAQDSGDKIAYLSVHQNIEKSYQEFYSDISFDHF